MNMAKAKRSVASQVGFWAFIAGLVIALVFGILSGLGIAMGAMPAIIVILIILGLVKG